MMQRRAPSASQQQPNMEMLFNPTLADPMLAKEPDALMFGAIDTANINGNYSNGLSEMPTLGMSISPQQILLQQHNGNSDFSLDFF